jgi:hypothetical protein
VAFSTLWESQTESGQSLFAKVNYANLGDGSFPLAHWLEGLETNLGPRQSTALVAPGTNVRLLGLDGRILRQTGTSFAAPHVTGTIALLQEYGDRQIRQIHQPSHHSWGLAARRHEVMKAVLLNSADKIKDLGDGFSLGMTRTMFTKRNRTWLDSEAYRNPKVPLDAELGAGQLHAVRAYTQFRAGQWEPENPVPPIGWDYRAIAFESATAPPFRDYVLSEPLPKGSFIAVTLTWDRQVELVDLNHNGEFDPSERFEDRGLNNLDLYLLNAADQPLEQAVVASRSDVDSVEHLFFKVPRTGHYKIRVQYRHQVNGPAQSYAIAWWSVAQPGALQPQNTSSTLSTQR